MQSGVSGLQSLSRHIPLLLTTDNGQLKPDAGPGGNQTADVSINDLYTSGVWSWSVTFLKLEGNKSDFALRHQIVVIVDSVDILVCSRYYDLIRMPMFCVCTQ